MTQRGEVHELVAGLREALGMLFVTGASPLPDAPHDARAIIRWWESRRLAFNLALGLIGVSGLLAAASSVVIGSLVIPCAPGFPDPFLAGTVGPAVVVLYALMANACYSAGWIVDVAATSVFRIRTGRWRVLALRGGTLFATGLTALPPLAVVLQPAAALVGRPSADDLPGRYAGELPGGWEELTLLPDGTCLEVAHPRSAESRVTSCAWRFEGSRVIVDHVFIDDMVFDRGRTNAKPTDGWELCVRRTLAWNLVLEWGADGVVILRRDRAMPEESTRAP